MKIHINKEIVYLFLLIIVLVIARFMIINLNSMEYSDSIYFISYFNNIREKLDFPIKYIVTQFWPPLYPFVIFMFSKISGLSLFLSGKIISIVFSSLVIIPVYLIAKYLYNKKSIIWISVVFVSIFPLLWIYSVRVMTESMFTFFFLLSFYYMIILSKEYNYNNLLLFICFSGFSTLVRWQGFIFLPFILFYFYYYKNFLFIDINIFKNKLKVFFSFIPWILLVIWIMLHGGGGQGLTLLQQLIISLYNLQFEKFILILLKILANFESYILETPYLLGYFLFFPFIYFIYKVYKKRSITDLLIITFLSLWVLAHTFFHNYNSRFMLPIYPIIIIVSVGSLLTYNHFQRIKKIIIYGYIFMSVIFLAVGMMAQKDVFGDFKKAAILAKFIFEKDKFDIILTDDSDKTPYLINKKFNKYNLDNIENLIKQHKKILVILHDYYTSIHKELFSLYIIALKFNYNCLFHKVKSIYIPIYENIDSYSYDIGDKAHPIKHESIVIELYPITYNEGVDNDKD